MRFLKRFAVILLILSILLSQVSMVHAASATASGACGPKLQWKLENNTLTITGTGSMDDYQGSYDHPWASYIPQIHKIVISKGVTTLGKQAFHQCDQVTKVTLPNTLTKIDIGAFNGCRSLSEITIPDSVTTLESNVFFGCESLTKIAIPPSITSLYSGMFGECYNLTTVILPDHMTRIHSHAFGGCSSLASIKLPTSLTEIGARAFSNCSALSSISIPEGVSKGGIGIRAFINCTALTSVSLPHGISQIAEGTFQYCSNLTSVVIPSTVTMIGQKAFDECYNLTDVYFCGSQTDWKKIPVGEYNTCLNSARIHFNYEIPVTEQRFITNLQPKGINVNMFGNATAYFRLTDDADQPLSGIKITCNLEKETKIAVTDGNGIFKIDLGSSAGSFAPTFSIEDFSGTLYGHTPYITVFHTPLAYSSTYTFLLGMEHEVSASIGAASSEIEIAKAALCGSMDAEFTVEDTYENGTRTISASIAVNESGGAVFETNLDHVFPSDSVTYIPSATSLVTDHTITGIKIPNYDPANPEHAKKLGSFALQTALLGVTSVWLNELLREIDLSAHNFSGQTNHYLLEAGSSLNIQGADDNYKLGSTDSAMAIHKGYQANYLENTRSSNVGFTMDAGIALLPVEEKYLEFSFGGIEKTNAIDLHGSFNNSGLDEITAQIYNGDKTNILIWSEQNSEILTYTFNGIDALAAARHNELLEDMLDYAISGYYGHQDLLDAIAALEAEDGSAQVTYTQTHTTGTEVTIPFLSFGDSIDAKFALNNDMLHAVSYPSKVGFSFNGNEYITAKSDVTTEYASQQAEDIITLLQEPVNTAIREINNRIIAVGEKVVDGVTNTVSSIIGTVKGWFVEIKRILTRDRSAYAIPSLMSVQDDDSCAAIAVTIGAPSVVEVYTDSTKQHLVAEEVLAENPLTLTMEYDDAMLAAAGASAASVIHIYRFDTERNVYICVPGCVQDFSKQSVTAAISHQGEYILATDSAAPLVANFSTSNLTPTPTLSAQISDLSGIRDFRFWLDNGADLVTADTLGLYYDESTGVFEFPITSALSAGTHTAYFQATDTLGNRNPEPFAFSFTVDASAPEITGIVVPTDPVTNEEGFTLTASVRDDTGVSSVFANVTTNTGKTYSMVLTETDGQWSAAIGNVAGLRTMTITLVATDLAGNQSETAPVQVRIDVAAKPVGIVLEPQYRSSALTVTVQNHDTRAIGGWLLAAFYDANGKMIETSSTYAGLLGRSNGTYNLEPAKSADAVSGKVFFLDVANGNVPFCEAVPFQ